MKKCLLSIRKNGKDVANIFDQDGMENRVTWLFSNAVEMQKSFHLIEWFEHFVTNLTKRVFSSSELLGHINQFSIFFYKY